MEEDMDLFQGRLSNGQTNVTGAFEYFILYYIQLGEKPYHLIQRNYNVFIIVDIFRKLLLLLCSCVVFLVPINSQRIINILIALFLSPNHTSYFPHEERY